MMSASSLLLLSGPLLTRVIVPVRVQYMGQIQQFNLSQEIIIIIIIIIIIDLKQYNCVQIICIRYEYLINRIINIK